MKKIKPNLAFLILLTAILSIVTSTSIPLQASTDNEDESESNDPEEEAEEAAKKGETEVYDDNPDLDKDGTVTEEENQKFQDAAVALADRLNNPTTEEEQEKEPDLIRCSDGITEVEDEDDCPIPPSPPAVDIPPAPAQAPTEPPAATEETTSESSFTTCPGGSIVATLDQCAASTFPSCDGSFQDCVTERGDVCEAGSGAHECESSVTCSDGTTVVAELSDCPPPPPATVPFPDGDANNDGILDRYQDEDYEPNPYCDLLKDRSVNCHDRKDYDEETLLYPCNDGTQKERWQDCEDVSGYDYDGKDKDKDRKKVIIKETKIIKKIINKGGGSSKNSDFNVDQVVVGITESGEALVCLANDKGDKIECEDFKVPENAVDKEIIEIVDFK